MILVAQVRETVTVIDGGTLSTSTVAVGVRPVDLAVNAATNRVYVANTCGNDLSCSSSGTVTAIDGASGATMPVAVGNAPQGVAVNTATNTAYVPNSANNTGSVVGLATTLQLTSVAPCRLVDTRGSGGPISGGTFRSFDVRRLARRMGAATCLVLRLCGRRDTPSIARSSQGADDLAGKSAWVASVDHELRWP